MLWSLHIPKTAGATFRSVLQSAFGDGLICAYGSGHPYDTSYASDYIFERRLSASEFANRCTEHATRCVHGHFEARRVLGTFTNERFVVWIRHPVERILSEYAHHRRERDPLNHFSMAIHDGRMTVEEFAAAEENRNVQSQYLDGISPERLAFVGISEQFDDDIHAFWRTLNLSHPLTYTRLNANPHRQESTYSISSDVHDYLAACNQDDLAIYHSHLARRQ